MQRRQLDYERLEVFQVVLELVKWSHPVTESVPRGNGYLLDQFNRALYSIGLNIAEGAGERSTGERARFYRIARRSAMESAAALDMMNALELIDRKTRDQAQDLLVRIVEMLTRLEQRVGN
jgi:four helix bundle protein